MAANPNPALIPDPIWWLWETERDNIPGARLGGIYASKSGYHNTVLANQSTWPGTYSIRFKLDTNFPPKDKARALDTTLSDEEMRKRTSYLKRAAEHPFDTRLYGLREFIGTLDSVNVFCMIRDTDSGPWQVDPGRDPSHLWHIHKSFWTKYCNDMTAINQIASVMLGVTWEEWLGGDDVAYRVNITSTVPEWNGKVVIGWPGGRFTARQPGVINAQLNILYPSVVNWADNVRGALTWDSFLDGVFGPDIIAGNAAIAAKLQAIHDAALDDGQVEVTLPPGMLEDIEQMITALGTQIKEAIDELETETRDAVADLGEGGAAQVRADA